VTKLAPGPKWRAFAAVSLGILSTTIDASIVNIALPAISRDFHASLSAVSWVNLVYLLAVTGSLLLLGQLSDLFGRRGIYISGFALFSIMALLCGLAPNLQILIVFRALQAIGASMMFANALAILATCFPAGERGRAFGMAAAFASAGVGIGPALGGGLVSALSWRWVFWFYSPIAMVGTFVAWRAVPRDTVTRRGDPLDLVGAGLTFVCMTSLVLGLKFLPGTTFHLGIILASVSLIAGIVLVWHARNTASPLVSPAFVTDPVLRSSTLDAFLGYLALYVYVLLLPFFLIDILRQPEALAGLVLTAEPALSIFTGPIGGRLSDRFGSKVLVLIGLGTTGIGLWALGGLSLHSSLWDATWRVAVIGMGFGLFYTPNNSALIGAAPVGRLGVATGIAEVASNLGMAAGIAVGSALVAGAGGGPMVSGPEFAADFGVAMRVSASVCLIAMIIGMLWMRTSGPKRYDPRNPSQQLRDQSAG